MTKPWPARSLLATGLLALTMSAAGVLYVLKAPGSQVGTDAGAPTTSATNAVPGHTATPVRTTLAPPTSGPTTAAPPTRPSKPGPDNTGVPAGVTLKRVNGDVTYRKDNQVISGRDIHGYVTIRAKNVTIVNSIIRGGTPRCNAAVLEVADGASATIKNSEIVAAHPNPCLDGIWATNATLTGLDIHGVVDGVKAYDNVVLEHSYVHDLSAFDSDPNQGGGPTHNDAVQTYEGNKHVTLRHNNLTVGSAANAAYQVTQSFGRVSTDLHIEDNWLDGGGCTLNFSHQGGPVPMTGIYVVGNRFGRHSYYQCPVLVSTQTTLSQFRDNVWADTGKPIPKPQRHD